MFVLTRKYCLLPKEHETEQQQKKTRRFLKINETLCSKYQRPRMRIFPTCLCPVLILSPEALFVFSESIGVIHFELKFHNGKK